jgi:L-2-hydroxyglutarate oxidase
MGRVVVVGSGIVGLAVARALALRGDDVLVLEKEDRLALHQTGRNSGVIHSGLYYAPGSAKARMCAAGARSMVEYARAHDVPVEICGKLVVAVDGAELPALRRLKERAVANGVPARMLDADEARGIEPAVQCVAALHVPTTGIVDYVGVCEAMAAEVRGAGGEVRFGEAFVAARHRDGGVDVLTDAGRIRADALVACAGLHADRVAEASGLVPEARIVPFRGEYYELAPGLEHLVRALVYPVPDPRFPFLGVHLTRMIHGGVHAGPNAVLALAREGYTWREVDARDLAQSLGWPGLWRLAARNLVPGAQEVARSSSRRLFARSLARLVPGIRAEDLVPAPAGVRAQALRRDGSLVDDFLIQSGPRQVHVLNAPSPAATCALEIAEHIVGELDGALVGV